MPPLPSNLDHILSVTPEVRGFFHAGTHTISYVVADPTSRQAVIIDSVLDYEPASATVSSESADAIIEYVRAQGYTIEWILETHIHADHLSAAQYLKEHLGGRIAIGEHITAVQTLFGEVFGDTSSLAQDGSQFDQLWHDGATFRLGDLEAVVLHTPGHTPADVSYLIGNALFVGDTLFMPDYGTARVDFPGGSAETLFASVQKLYALPDTVKVYLCHDYLPPNRSTFAWETSVKAEKENNIHLNQATQAADFARMRQEKDATLGMPQLIIPALQVNMRAGKLPQDETTGRPMLKIPVNSLFSQKR